MLRFKTIAHLNFAKGFRGGERQSMLLIESLAARGHIQVLYTRIESELALRCADIKNLTIIKLAKPYIFSFKKFKNVDLLQAHETKAAQVAYFVNRIYKIPFVVTRRVDNPIKNNFFNRAIYTNAASVVALSGAIEKEIIVVAPQAKVKIIASSLADFQVNQSMSEQIKQRFANKFLIGNIGELHNAHKGQYYLIEALKRLEKEYPDIHCIFLGKGADLANYQQQSKGLTNITFEGFVDNVGDYIHCFDLFVFPSLNEGLGSILLDVMQQNVPIVASDVGGIPDILTHDKTALLTPPMDSDAIYQQIMVLYNNQDKRESLSSAAYTHSQKYHPSNLADHYIAMYENI